MSSGAGGSLLAPVRRIAVVRPNHRLGNTLLLTPLVQELQEHFPDAQIDLITASSDAPAVFERYPRVEAVQFPARSYEHPLRVLGLLGLLRGRRYDLAIDPIPRQRAGRFLLGWIKARDRVGYRWGVSWRDRTLTHLADAAAAPRHFAHAPLYLLRTAYLSRIGVPGEASAPMPALDLRLTSAERAAGAERLAKALAGAGARSDAVRHSLALFAHATGAKGFPIDWWQQLIEALKSKLPNAQLIEIVPADRRPRLAGVMPGLHTPELRLLAATLAATSLLVIPDGGVLHVAEAAGARMLGLFKTTDPTQYGPTRSGSEALWAADATIEVIAARICALFPSMHSDRG
jgi:heptosyltransferase III